MTVSTAAPVMTWSVMRRRRAMGATGCIAGVLAASGIGPRRLAPSDGPDQQSCQSVDDDRNQEESQSNLDQGGAVDQPRGLTEFIGQYAGHGIARREQGLHDLRIVSDHHGDGHGFSQSPA